MVFIGTPVPAGAVSPGSGLSGAPPYPAPPWSPAAPTFPQRWLAAVRVAWWAGFRDATAPAYHDAIAEPEWRRAARIVMGESRANPLAFNEGGGEKGLWQFHPRYWGEQADESDLDVPFAVQFDPWMSSLAARAVVDLYSGNPGSGWRAWFGGRLFHRFDTATYDGETKTLDQWCTFFFGDGTRPSLPGTMSLAEYNGDYASGLATLYGQRVLAGDGLFPPRDLQPVKAAPAPEAGAAAAAAASAADDDGLGAVIVLGGAVVVLGVGWWATRRRRR